MTKMQLSNQINENKSSEFLLPGKGKGKREVEDFETTE